MEYGVFEYNGKYYRVREDAETDAEQYVYDTYKTEEMTGEDIQLEIDLEIASIEEIDDDTLNDLLYDMRERSFFMGLDYDAQIEYAIEILNS